MTGRREFFNKKKASTVTIVLAGILLSALVGAYAFSPYVVQALADKGDSNENKGKDDNGKDHDDDNGSGTGTSDDDKVVICHIPPGNPENAHTIEVSENAVGAHQAHGDTLGQCPPSSSDDTDDDTDDTGTSDDDNDSQNDDDNGNDQNDDNGSTNQQTTTSTSNTGTSDNTSTSGSTTSDGTTSIANVNNDSDSPAPVCLYVDLETVKLTGSFTSNGTMPIADVAPFSITGGHVSLGAPTGNGFQLIAAQITDSGAQHAVVLNFTKTLTLENGESLYHIDLKSSFTGTNPYTGQLDTVSNITDLLLKNNGEDIRFSDNNALTMTIIFQ